MTPASRSMETPPPTAVCPICGSGATVVKNLPAKFIRDSLADYYGAPVPDSVSISPYEIMRCGKCRLEYADPMAPGDDAFYSWISGFADYYPQARWEWPVVLNELKQGGPSPKSLLEVGCGAGAFLQLASGSLPNLTAVGLDPTHSAIEECKARGLRAYSETLQEYAMNPGHDRKQFDYICAFHCLEHVSDPKGLLEAIIPLTHEDSRIYFSTPYSPMSFETAWHDPLNYPPHHMTRWNATAYHELAARVGWQVDLLMPQAQNAIIRTLIALNLLVHGPHGDRDSPLATTLKHPLIAAGEMRRQLSRERLDGRVAPDVVLARFRRKHSASVSAPGDSTHR